MLKKFVIKVKTDFNQAQQNQFTFNRFSLKVKTFRIKLNKIMSSLSRNYLSRARDIWDKLKRSLLFTTLLTELAVVFDKVFGLLTALAVDLERSSCWKVIGNLGLIWNETWNWHKFFVESNESDLLSLIQYISCLWKVISWKWQRYFVELDSKCLDLERKLVEGELILLSFVADAATIEINQQSIEVQMGIILHGNQHWRRWKFQSQWSIDCLFHANVDDSRKLKIIT